MHSPLVCGMWASNWHNWHQGKLLVVLCSVSSRLLVPGLSCVYISSGLLVPWRPLVPQICRSFCRAAGAATCFVFALFRRVDRAATRFLRSSLYMSLPLFRPDSWSHLGQKYCLLFYSFNYLHETLFIAYSLIISGRWRNGKFNPMKRVSIISSRRTEGNFQNFLAKIQN